MQTNLFYQVEKFEISKALGTNIILKFILKEENSQIGKKLTKFRTLT